MLEPLGKLHKDSVGKILFNKAEDSEVVVVFRLTTTQLNGILTAELFGF